jgi:polyferredoxin
MKGFFDRLGIIIVFIGVFFWIQKVGPYVYYESLYLINGKDITAKVVKIDKYDSGYIIEFQDVDIGNGKLYRTNELSKNKYFIGEIKELRVSDIGNVAIHWKRMIALYIILFLSIIIMTLIAIIYGRRFFMPEEKLKLYRKLGSSPKKPIL